MRLVLGLVCISVVLASFATASQLELVTVEDYFCGDAFSADSPRAKGQVTHLGHNSAEYFSELKRNGLPRYVLTVGAPGSGKSYWVKEARKSGWVVVAPDEIRSDYLVAMKNRGEKIMVSGVEEVPDPLNPNHIFSLEVRTKGLEIAEQMVRIALAEGKSVVDDKASNGFITRAAAIQTARNSGYWVDGLVFHSASSEINAANISLRGSQGGPTLDPAIIPVLFNQVRFYSSILRVDSDLTKAGAQLPVFPGALLGSLPKAYSTIDEAVAHLTAEERDILQAYLKADVFNAIEMVSTSNYDSN